MAKMARRSFGPDAECKHPWPDDCLVQCGEDGLVLPAGEFHAAVVNADLGPVAAGYAGAIPGAYRTAFFESFPVIPSVGTSIFLRGEGNSLLEAEDKCWRAYKLILACPGHDLYRSEGYTNGMATCKICGMMGAFMDPSTKCKSCGEPTDYYSDYERGDWFCEKCLPEAKDQPCRVCKQRDPPTSYLKTWWRPKGSNFREFLHPECNRQEAEE
jgi:hypothetical protein